MMEAYDAGHDYLLEQFDMPLPDCQQRLTFMKREGEGYPNNEGSHGGTNCQEVLRALIDRVKYLEVQRPCPENAIILLGLRSALIAFEVRAARRHGRELPAPEPYDYPEYIPTRKSDGHWGKDGGNMAEEDSREVKGIE